MLDGTTLQQFGGRNITSIPFRRYTGGEGSDVSGTGEGGDYEGGFNMSKTRIVRF